MTKVVLRLPTVKARSGLSRSTIYRRIAEGTFPKGIQLGSSRTVGWLESDIEAWIDKQIHESGSPNTPIANRPRTKRRITKRVDS